MGQFVWYLTDKRKALITAAKQAPDYGARDVSQILEEALTEWLKVHGKANPMYSLDHFADPGAKAFLSPWKVWYIKDLEPYTDEDMEEMQTIMKRRLEQLAVLRERRRMTYRG